MSNVLLDERIVIRLPKSLLKESRQLMHQSNRRRSDKEWIMKYESFSHYVRVALVILNRNEKENLK